MEPAPTEPEQRPAGRRQPVQSAGLNGAGSDGAGTGSSPSRLWRGTFHASREPAPTEPEQGRQLDLATDRCDASMEPAPTEPEQHGLAGRHRSAHHRPQWSRLRRSRNRLPSMPTEIRSYRLNGAGSDGAG